MSGRAFAMMTASPEPPDRQPAALAAAGSGIHARGGAPGPYPHWRGARLRRLMFHQRRAVLGVLLAVYLPLVVNVWLGLGWFGPHARRAAVLAMVVVGGVWWYMAPSLAEVEAHAAARRRARRPT